MVHTYTLLNPSAHRLSWFLQSWHRFRY